MDASKLVHMANQIGAFFESMPDRQQALIDIAGHLKKFWDPRMRRELLQYVDEQGEAELSGILQETVRTHRASIL